MKKLKKHLAPLKREGKIKNWYDRKIVPGKNWEQEIDENINKANIILLLLSASFIASDYCYEKEMKRALERHKNGEAYVIPVFLKPFDWTTDAPFAKLQGLPTDAKPITTWKNRDDAFKDVAIGIRAIIEDGYESKNLWEYQGQGSDWGVAPDVPFLFGREREIEQLRDWIIDDGCHVVVIVGMGGLGKTVLASKFSKDLASDEDIVHEENFLKKGEAGKTLLSTDFSKKHEWQFERVIWRKFIDDPPIDRFLSDLNRALLGQSERDLPESLSDQISILIDYLNKHRCLLVFDNIETILESGSGSMEYRKNRAGYKKLFERIAQENHCSCLLITSRERLKHLYNLSGSEMPLRFLELTGLTPGEGKKIFSKIGYFEGKSNEWKYLINYYGGNPLALKVVAHFILDVYNGSISKFLNSEDKVKVKDIQDLLDSQIKRFEKDKNGNRTIEMNILYWLAISRISITIDDLERDVVDYQTKKNIGSALQNLLKWLPLEKSKEGFTIQPVFMEHVTKRFVKKIVEEIETIQPDLLKSYPLIKVTQSEHLREKQTNVILEQICSELSDKLGKKTFIANMTQIALLPQVKMNVKHSDYLAGNILNLLVHLKSDLSKMDFTGLSIRQAYLKNCELHGIKFCNSVFRDCVFASTFANIRSVAFSPDSKYLATGSVDSEVLLWEVNGLRLIRGHREHTGCVLCVASWQPDKDSDDLLIASGSDDKTVRIWSVKTGRREALPKKHSGWVMSVSFSPDGRFLACGCANGNMIVWDISKKEIHFSKDDHKDRIGSVAFSQNGKYLASGSEDWTIKIYDTLTGEYKGTLSEHSNRVFTIDFFEKNGKTMLASGSEDLTIKIWDIENETCLATMEGHKDRIRSISVSPDGKTIASGSQDKTIRLWDINTKKQIRLLDGHTNRIRSVVYSPNGGIIASVADDQTLRLWDSNSGHLLSSLLGYTSRIKSIAFDPNLKEDKMRFVCGSEDRSLRLWNLNTRGQKLKQKFKLRGHNGGVWAVAFNKDGTKIISGSDDQTLRIWNNKTGKLEKIIPPFGPSHYPEGHKHRIFALSFSLDRRFFASACEDQDVRIWDARSWRYLCTLLENDKEHTHDNGVTSVAFDKEATFLATGSDDKTVKLWEVKDWKHKVTIHAHIERVNAVAFSPDGTILASGSKDKAIKIWNIEKLLSNDPKSCIQNLAGHKSGILCLAFHPTQKKLASGSSDNTIIIWDMQTWKPKWNLKGHNAQVNTLAYSLDGRFLISGSDDDYIIIWDTETGKLKYKLRADRLYEGMDISGTTGLKEAEVESLRVLGAVWDETNPPEPDNPMTQ